MKTTQNLRNPLRDLTQENISAGLLAAIFGCVATSLIIINSGAQAGLTDGQIVSWLFSCWFFVSGLENGPADQWRLVDSGGSDAWRNSRTFPV